MTIEIHVFVHSFSTFMNKNIHELGIYHNNNKFICERYEKKDTKYKNTLHNTTEQKKNYV